MKVDYNGPGAQTRDEMDGVVDQWLAQKGNRRFGKQSGEREQSGSQAGCEDHGANGLAHFSSPPKVSILVG